MHKLFSSFLVLSMLCHSVLAGTGETDERVYVDWSSAPYNKIVKVRTVGGWCTGQFVAPNIILTARHCIADDKEHDNYVELNSRQITAIKHDNTRIPTRVISYGYNYHDDDWGFLLVEDPEYYHNTYFDIPAQDNANITVTNAGFGYMRILTDAEIQQLQNIWTQVEATMPSTKASFSDIYDNATNEIDNAGIPPLAERVSKLKAHIGCKIEGRGYWRPYTVETTCDSFAGNSGGPYWSGNDIYGICSSGVDSWEEYWDTDYAVPPSRYHAELEKIKAEYPATVQKPTTTTTDTGSKPTDTGSKPTNTGSSSDNGQLNIERPTKPTLRPPQEEDTDSKPTTTGSDSGNGQLNIERPPTKPTLRPPQDEDSTSDTDSKPLNIYADSDDVVIIPKPPKLPDLGDIEIEEPEDIEIEDDFVGLDDTPPALLFMEAIEEEPLPPQLPDLGDIEIEEPEDIEIEDDFVGLDDTPPEVLFMTYPEEIDEEPLPPQLPDLGDIEIDDNFIELDNHITVPAMEKQLQEMDTHLSEQVHQVKNMSKRDFLVFLANSVEFQKLRERYEQALARERSLPNRMLGALGIGAGGVGGMMIASGIAEQRADQNAEIDMRAYLATFRCDAGTGEQWKGGETNIELPAGNLTALKTEYVTLADNLKSRKEQLGLKPGIESETIADSASTGLYDNVASSPIDGVYTSIANAILDENSSDATEWAEQKEKTTTKIQTGTKIGVTGVGGAMIGNMTVNRDMYFNTDQDTDTESEEETESTRNVSKRTTRRTTKRNNP